MARYIMNKKVLLFLQKNPSICRDIIDKIKKCLEDNLLVSVNSCNKHELKGNCKGYWRLHLPHDFVIIYEIIGERPNRCADILKIMSEKEYHNWIKSC